MIDFIDVFKSWKEVLGVVGIMDLVGEGGL